MIVAIAIACFLLLKMKEIWVLLLCVKRLHCPCDVHRCRLFFFNAFLATFFYSSLILFWFFYLIIYIHWPSFCFLSPDF